MRRRRSLVWGTLATFGGFVGLLAGCQSQNVCRGVVAIGAETDSAALLKADGSIWTWNPGATQPASQIKSSGATGFSNAGLCLRLSSGDVSCPLVYAPDALANALAHPQEVSSWFNTDEQLAGGVCGVLLDGTLTCALGNDESFSTIAQGVKNVSIGSSHLCWVTDAATLACQPMEQTVASAAWTAAGASLTDVVEVVSAEPSNTPGATVRTADGSVWSLDQLSSATDATVTETQVVDVPAAVSQLVEGDTFACALTSDGAVSCWVFTDGTQGTSEILPPADRVAQWVPQNIATLPGPATALAAGDSFVCALLQEGTVWCWGGSVNGSFAALVDSCG